VTIFFNLAAMLARVPFPSAPLAAANLRIDWIVILLSIPSMSGGVALAASSIGSSVTGVSVAVVASTSIAGSTSGAAGSGAVGAVGSGSIASAGVVVAGSRMPIASVANLTTSASKECIDLRRIDVVQHHQRRVNLGESGLASLLD
jgi:hypothetical protein